jgi:hypothetical protein
MELDPYLVTVPGHMIMGVYLNEEHREQLEIETTMAGASPFEDAVKVGSGIHGKSEGEFDGENPISRSLRSNWTVRMASSR